MQCNVLSILCNLDFLMKVFPMQLIMMDGRLPLLKSLTIGYSKYFTFHFEVAEYGHIELKKKISVIYS